MANANLRSVGLICFVACLFTAGVEAFAGDSVKLEKRPVKVSIFVEGGSVPTENTLRVSVANGSKARTWRFVDESLDAEPNAKKAELASINSRDFLLVHGYTDGAYCCWEMAVIDLQQMKSLGWFLASQGSIDITHDTNGCAVGAWVQPLYAPDEQMPERMFYCFNGMTFVRWSAKPPGK